jgi:hypothetical protein
MRHILVQHDTVNNLCVFDGTAGNLRQMFVNPR